MEAGVIILLPEDIMIVLFSVVVLFAVLPSSGVSIAGWVAASVVFIQPADRKNLFLEDRRCCQLFCNLLAKLQVAEEFQRVPVNRFA